MATAKWAAPSAQGANIAGTTLDSLANGASSAFIIHDNSTNLDLYAGVEIVLGSIAAVAGASITLRAYPTSGGTAQDDTGSVGGGDSYTIPITATTSAKRVVVPMVRLYPVSMRFQVTNNAGVALAATGNSIKVQPFNESVT